MTNFEYYIKGDRAEESWLEAWSEFLKFNEAVSKKDKTGSTIRRYNRWLLEEHKEPILDDVEREYLSSVIKPFRKNVLSISKQTTSSCYYIYIGVAHDYGNDFVVLPKFEKSTRMYTGMKPNHKYTLKELGL